MFIFYKLSFEFQEITLIIGVCNSIEITKSSNKSVDKIKSLFVINSFSFMDNGASPLKSDFHILENC